VRRACTSDLKAAGDLLYLVGKTRKELGGSYYYRLHGLVGNSVPRMAQEGPAAARALHRAMSSGLVRACHDCSEGGLGVALAEMALASRLGADVSLAEVPVAGDDGREEDWLLFSESNGRYLVEVSPEEADAFESGMGGVCCARIGRVVERPALNVTACQGRGTLFSLPVADIRQAWRGHIQDHAGQGRNR